MSCRNNTVHRFACYLFYVLCKTETTQYAGPTKKQSKRKITI